MSPQPGTSPWAPACPCCKGHDPQKWAGRGWRIPAPWGTLAQGPGSVTGVTGVSSSPSSMSSSSPLRQKKAELDCTGSGMQRQKFVVLPAPQSSLAGEGPRGKSPSLWFRGQSLLASDTLLKRTRVPGRSKIRGSWFSADRCHPELRPPALKGASNAAADAGLAGQCGV